MASTGFIAPDKEDNGGLMKKAVNCACCADLLKVAITVPRLIPDKMHNMPPNKTKSKLP